MHRLRERDGWTLIEILTILAIVGVMSTMAVASLRSYSRREDIRRAARSVSSLFETALRRSAVDEAIGIQRRRHCRIRGRSYALIATPTTTCSRPSPTRSPRQPAPGPRAAHLLVRPVEGATGGCAADRWTVEGHPRQAAATNTVDGAR
jgi:type II secretory pathway pseudopilin PulG